MPLHPQARAFMELRAALGWRPFEFLTPEEARAQEVVTRGLSGPGEPVAAVRDTLIPGLGGEIPLRVYTPEGSGPFPLLVYFHGGGWVVGSLDSADVLCRYLTNAAHCVVVSANYRHAPEHRYPAAAEDAYAATAWAAAHAHELGADTARVAVAGSSAGGNLAAVTALMARDRGGPPLAAQLLIVPVTQYGFDTLSYRENAEGYSLTRAGMETFWRHYLASAADGAQPYASPLRSPDLRGLPPAIVLTAEYDPLRDEGEAYAARLREAGVPVVQRRCEGMIHPFLGAEANAWMAQELRERLHGTGTPALFQTGTG